MKQKKPKLVVPDVANARFWAASRKVALAKEETPIILECERWNDARTVAIRLFGGAEAVLTQLDPSTMRKLPVPRVQVRWVGMAARRVPDLRMQTRTLHARSSTAWCDL